MGKIFGTDGARGIAGTELTCELAMKIGRAAAAILTKHCKVKPMILIGRDTRISSKMLEAALTAGICSAGADSTSIGVVSTPAMAYLIGKYRADAGIMISASHNPMEYNGIKIFNKDGYKLSDDIEDQIEDYILNKEDELNKKYIKSGAQIGRSFARRSAHSDYIAHLVNTIDGDLSGIRVVVDCANGSASATAEQLLRTLGASPIIINEQPNGQNINKGCGSTHIEELADFVKEHKCEVGIAFDGDADRCLAVDENGNVVDGDQLIAVFAKDMKERGELADNTVVVTVMSNFGFFEFAKQNQINVQKTKVGDRYVLDNMIKNGFTLGGEQSGHIIFRDYASTGDGQLTAIKLLSILKKSDAPFSKLAEVMQRYPQILINVDADAEQKKQYERSGSVERYIKSKEKDLNGDGRVLVRVSGTEPYIRIMVEGKSKEQIENIGRDIERQIKECIKQRN